MSTYKFCVSEFCHSYIWNESSSCQIQKLLLKGFIGKEKQLLTSLFIFSYNNNLFFNFLFAIEENKYREFLTFLNEILLL